MADKSLTIQKDAKIFLEVSEMWICRGMLHISWTAKMSHLNVLKEVKAHKNMTCLKGCYRHVHLLTIVIF